MYRMNIETSGKLRLRFTQNFPYLPSLVSISLCVFKKWVFCCWLRLLVNFYDWFFYYWHWLYWLRLLVNFAFWHKVFMVQLVNLFAEVIQVTVKLALFFCQQFSCLYDFDVV